MKRPAYAKDFLQRVADGERFVLVVLAVRDWDAGRWFDARGNVARLVIGADDSVVDCDLSIVMGFDVLVVGGEDADFYAACRIALAYGAASVWANFDDGFWRVEHCRMSPGVVAIERIADPEALLERVPLKRDIRLIAGEGVFAAPVFREARIAAWGHLFGAAVAERLRARFAA